MLTSCVGGQIEIHVALFLRFIFSYLFALTPLAIYNTSQLTPSLFRFKPFSWLQYITLTPACSIISYRNIIFYLRLWFTPTFSETQLGRKTRIWRSDKV